MQISMEELSTLKVLSLRVSKRVNLLVRYRGRPTKTSGAELWLGQLQPSGHEETTSPSHHTPPAVCGNSLTNPHLQDAIVKPSDAVPPVHL